MQIFRARVLLYLQSTNVTPDFLWQYRAMHVIHGALKHHKSSAVAEMGGDRAKAKWAEKWGGAAVPLSVGELGPI